MMVINKLKESICEGEALEKASLGGWWNGTLLQVLWAFCDMWENNLEIGNVWAQSLVYLLCPRVESHFKAFGLDQCFRGWEVRQICTSVLILHLFVQVILENQLTCLVSVSSSVVCPIGRADNTYCKYNETIKYDLYG